MKKVLSMILAFVLCLSLCACGKNGGTDSSAESQSLEVKDYVIGTWERCFTNSKGQNVKQTIEIYKGGTGKFLIYSDREYSYVANWEIKDDILNFTYTMITLGLILDTTADPMTLTQVDDDTAVFRKSM